MCMTCTSEFNVVRRRHHCRGCGKVRLFQRCWDSVIQLSTRRWCAHPAHPSRCHSPIKTTRRAVCVLSAMKLIRSNSRYTLEVRSRLSFHFSCNSVISAEAPLSKKASDRRQKLLKRSQSIKSKQVDNGVIAEVSTKNIVIMLAGLTLLLLPLACRFCRI